MVNLDIVVVNWNAGNQLYDCLHSIQASNSDPIFQLSSCTVVDNASSDGSAEKLSDLPFNLTVIRNLKNRGFGSACNQGAKVGDAGYILFLNPDIRLFPGSLGKALLWLEQPRNKDIGILGIQLVDVNGNLQRNISHFPTPWSILYRMVGLDRLWPVLFPPYFMSARDHQESREVDHVQGAFFLLRREVYEELGGFDERFFMYFEDVDFAYRANQAGWKSYYFAQAQAFHRGGGTSQQIKAARLSYWMAGRLLYASKHFGCASTIVILLASFGLEFWARIGWCLVNFSRQHLAETLRAYGIYIKSLPQLLRGRERCH